MPCLHGSAVVSKEDCGTYYRVVGRCPYCGQILWEVNEQKETNYDDD